MSDSRNAEVLDFLRERFGRVDAALAELREGQRELTHRVGALEISTAGMRRDIADLHGVTAHLSVRMDTMNDRLVRIERRLELVDAH